MIATVLLVTPDPETVIAAVLGVVAVLAPAVTVIVPVFTPEVLLSVNHGWSQLAVQFTLEVTVNVDVLFAAAFRFSIVGDIANDGDAA